jgi:aldose 1-epimerase
MKTASKMTTWDGQPAVYLQAGDWEAILLPGHGGNLISLKNHAHGFDLLRTPPDFAVYAAKPEIWGIPVLFPPNRTADGEFTFNGQHYVFPINEEERHNNLHGFLSSAVWQVHRLAASETEAQVELRFELTESSPIFAYLPHEFQFCLTYTLTQAGLEQGIRITNKSERPMPLGLGFHTAFKVPFAPGTSEADCRLQVTLGAGRWEMDESRHLPTEKLLPLTERDVEMKTTGICPSFETISGHFPARDGFNCAILSCTTLKTKVVYEVDPQFKHWMIWNYFGDKGFVCPEPQTYMVNAPNLNLPADISGMQALAPGAQWRSGSRIYLQKS